MKYLFLGGLTKQIIMGTWQGLVAGVGGPSLCFKEWESSLIRVAQNLANEKHFCYSITTRSVPRGKS